jgi:hypothetical protein
MKIGIGREGVTRELGTEPPAPSVLHRQEAVAKTIAAGFPWLDCYSGPDQEELAGELVDQIFNGPNRFDAQLEAFASGTINVAVVEANVRRKAMQERAKRLEGTGAFLNAGQVLIKIEQEGVGQPFVAHVLELTEPTRRVG